MNQAQKLQKLVDQIDQLQGSKVYRVAMSYYVRGDSINALYFETFRKGESWLKRWIASGRRPPYSELRIGVRAS